MLEKNDTEIAEYETKATVCRMLEMNFKMLTFNSSASPHRNPLVSKCLKTFSGCVGKGNSFKVSIFSKNLVSMQTDVN